MQSPRQSTILEKQGSTDLGVESLDGIFRLLDRGVGVDPPFRYPSILFAPRM